MSADYKLLIEAAPDGVVVSQRGLVKYANPAALRLLGYERVDELVGQSMSTFLSAEDVQIMRERIMAIARGARLPPRVYPARRRDGVAIAAEITSLPIRWEGEDSVIAFARDVTERIKLEADLARAERLASVGTLATGIAHEINNPLAFASLALERVERLVVGDAATSSFRAAIASTLADARSGMDRVAAIVRDLQAFTRAETDGSARAEVASAAASAVRMLSPALARRARLEVGGLDLPALRMAPLRLEQVLTNLLTNALQAFPETPAGAAPAEHRVVLDGETQGDHVVLRVVDNASGMTDEVRARALDPFFTTKPGVGTGLGLWLCHTLVTQAGGAIELTSRVGAGTTVAVRVPRADDARPMPQAPPVASSGASESRLRVLVIDDEPSLLRTVDALLADDYLVDVSASGLEAIARLAGGLAPDVILCDLSMPGLTGADVFARIARERPGLEARMVFMTGGAFTDAAREFLERVPNLRVEKPFSYAALDRALRHAARGGEITPSSGAPGPHAT